MKFHDVWLPSEDLMREFKYSKLGVTVVNYLSIKWHEQGRPYYKLWPCIHEPVERLSLSRKLSDFPHDNEDVIAIRFPEVAASPTPGPTWIRSVVACRMKTERRSGLLLSCACEMPNRMIASFTEILPDDADLQGVSIRRDDITNPALWGGLTPDKHPEGYLEVVVTAIKTALFVMLIRSDPEFVQPDVLAKDEPNFASATPDRRQVMVERARRRGKFGFHVGRETEMVPHWRRPHFALRWTGAGGLIPRIVPVKAAVVHREKVTSVPTGRYREDSAESGD